MQKESILAVFIAERRSFPEVWSGYHNDLAAKKSTLA
jgi:hypothetical protein